MTAFEKFAQRVDRVIPDATTEDRQRVIFLTLASYAITVIDNHELDAQGNPTIELAGIQTPVTLGLTPDTPEFVQEHWQNPYGSLDEVR